MKFVLKRIIKIVACVAGFATVLLILFNMLNGKFDFLSEATANHLLSVQNWLILLDVALLGLEFALSIPFLLIVYLILVAAIVILACIPGFELPLVGGLLGDAADSVASGLLTIARI